LVALLIRDCATNTFTAILKCRIAKQNRVSLAHLLVAILAVVAEAPLATEALVAVAKSTSPTFVAQ
jgi:hypothetical protein